MKFKILKIASAFILLASTSSLADDSTKAQIAVLQKQVEQLQQQLNLLQRKQEVVEEVTTANNQKFATVELNNKGLNITSPDKQYGFKVRGYAQVDSRNFVSNDNNVTDQFLVRSARPQIDVKLANDFAGRVTLDFGSNQQRLVDAYVDYKLNDFVSFRGGKFKTPVGLERWVGETETLFAERGLTANLVPFRDVGLQAFGEIILQTLEYQVGVSNGGVDLSDNSVDNSGGKDIFGRIFAQPFKNTDISYLQGLGAGFAGSFGQHDGNTTTTELPVNYKTTGQNNFFTSYATNTFANGKSSRLNPQAWYYNGSFGSIAEYVTSENRVTLGANNAKLKNEAWSASASYVVTGEDAAFDGVKPRTDFSLDKGTWGALEIAARVGKLTLDDKTFPTYGSLNTIAKEVEERTVGLNWYLNPNIKATLNYSNNSFEGGATGGRDRADENVIISRVQFKY